MAEGVNVRLSRKLRNFIAEQTGPDGLYENASEYVRDLIRSDFKRLETNKWNWLYEQLTPGMEAGEDEFVPFDAESIIATAKKQKAENAS